MFFSSEDGDRVEFSQVSKLHIAKLTVVIANQTGILRSDPQVAMRVSCEPENRTGGDARRVGVSEKPEVQTIEPHQTVFTSNPQVSVAGLGNGAHRSARVSFF